MPFPRARKSMTLGAVGLIVLLVILIAKFQEGPTSGSNHGGSAFANAHGSPVHATPISIVPAANVDERLFLLRVLNELNDSWPGENLPADQLQNALTNLRRQATAIRDHLRGKSDASLVEAYDKFLHTLGDYTGYLADLGHVQRVADDRSEKEASESGFNAGWNGAAVGYGFSDRGYSNSQSVVAGGVVALGSYFWDDYQKGKERDEAKRQAIEAAQIKLNASVADYLGFCRATASSLSDKYGWKPGEAGFDNSKEDDATRAMLLKQANADALVKLAQGWQARRPRDPFVVRDKAYFVSRDPHSSITSQLSVGKECLKAATLIPNGPFYDEYRGELLYVAGDAFDRAAGQEIGDKAWGTAFNQDAALATQAWNACLGYEHDSTGEIRERKAWDLFKSGDLEESLNVATPLISLRQGDADFCTFMACLLSDMGDVDNSLAWIKQAVVTLGYNNIGGLKEAADLETLRKKKGKELADLTSIHCAWKIDYGVFNDDLIVTNESPFALTHLAVGGSVTPNNKTWDKMLTADSIPAGKSYTWSSAFSVPGSKIDESRSSLKLRCDQGECAPTLKP